VGAFRVGGSSVDVADKELTRLADLSEGDVRRGYVVSAGSVGVLVRSAARHRCIVHMKFIDHGVSVLDIVYLWISRTSIK